MSDGKTSEPAAAPSPPAWQTGPNVGPNYAGGMYYDAEFDAIYITGATYSSFGSNDASQSDSSYCLFAKLNWPELEFVHQQTYGTEHVDEACNAVSVSGPRDSLRAIVVGSTEAAGLLSSLDHHHQSAQYGIALDLAKVQNDFHLQGGAVMDSGTVKFPVAVETDQQGNAWVVSMMSTDKNVTANMDKTSTTKLPNLTTGGIEKYGSHYTVAVEYFELQRTSPQANVDTLTKTLKRKWFNPFHSLDDESIFVSDVISARNSEVIIVVGTAHQTAHQTDMDGYIAKMDPQTGEMSGLEHSTKEVSYFHTQKGNHDWLFAACHDPNDSQFFYVVGATEGTHDGNQRQDSDITVHAVAAKVNVDSLTVQWIHQFPVQHADGSVDKPAAAAAYGCSVTSNGNIYVAGVVENGATVVGTNLKSAGRDDVFVAQLSKNGVVRWIQQIGSNGDDRIAHGGGIAADANGNAIVFGDTNGSLFRSKNSDDKSRQHYSDLFLMTLDKDTGDHQIPHGGKPTSQLPSDTSTPSDFYPNNSEHSTESNSVAGLAILLTLLAIFMVGYGRHQAKKRADAQKSSVFRTLQNFDVQDVELQPSPAGGWHGVYQNKLVYGVNRAETAIRGTKGRLPGTYEMSPMGDSSVVRDSLFVDDMPTTAPSSDHRDVGTIRGRGRYSDRRRAEDERNTTNLRVADGDII